MESRIPNAGNVFGIKEAAMTIRVNIRQLGKKRCAVSAVPFELPAQPATLREMITMLVQGCVSAYNARVRQGEGGIRPMTEEALSGLESIGKLAFGVNHGEKRADAAQAVQLALQGFGDGLYRVFLDGTEVTALDAPLTLHDDDELTLIRLTMLAGSTLLREVPYV